VAVGDVSDASHIAGAAADCFSAVLLTEVAFDGRERSFTPDGAAVLAAWAAALADASITRAIWVGSAPPEGAATPETAIVETGTLSPADIATQIVEIDDRHGLP